MKKLIIANWKMTPRTVKEAEQLVSGIQKDALKLRNTEVVICPPFVYLDCLSKFKVKLGSQDVFWERTGSYTGEVSISMLKNFGVKYVIA
ncbi:unnamed protein product, partial [marine sediment metagenome]